MPTIPWRELTFSVLGAVIAAGILTTASATIPAMRDLLAGWVMDSGSFNEKVLGEVLREFAEMQRRPGGEITLDNTINDPGWGDWSSWAYCPEAHYVCGISQRVFPPSGSDVDDTAMAGVKFRCCPLVPNGP